MNFQGFPTPFLERPDPGAMIFMTIDQKLWIFFMCYCETDAPFVGQNKVYCQNKMQIILNSNPVLSLECA